MPLQAIGGRTVYALDCQVAGIAKLCAWVEAHRDPRLDFWDQFDDCMRQPAQALPQPKRPQHQRTLRQPVLNAERVSIHKAVAILGLPLRTVQELSARGEIPGAAKLGRRWSFDIEKLRRLVRQRERETWQNGKHRPDATGAAIPSGRGLKFVGAKSDGRFTQVTRRLRGGNIRSGGSG